MKHRLDFDRPHDLVNPHDWLWQELSHLLSPDVAATVRNEFISHVQHYTHAVRCVWKFDDEPASLTPMQLTALVASLVSMYGDAVKREAIGDLRVRELEAVQQAHGGVFPHARTA
jgi:hypothetical protein